MLSDSLDPVQDLSSPVQGGLCPSCKIQRGGLCPSCKIYGGDFVHVYKNEQGGFVRGDYVRYLLSKQMVLYINIIKHLHLGVGPNPLRCLV